MQSRYDRHLKIIQLVEANEIGTQTELTEALAREGFQVTQATLSRDIKELGLIKVRSGGRFRYATRQNIESSTTSLHTTHATLAATKTSLSSVKQFIRTIDWSGNTVVIITDSGAAGPVAEAIDRLSLSDVLGTVAGDNTIFLVVKRDIAASELVKRLESLLLG